MTESPEKEGPWTCTTQNTFLSVKEPAADFDVTRSAPPVYRFPDMSKHAALAQPKHWVPNTPDQWQTDPGGVPATPDLWQRNPNGYPQVPATPDMWQVAPPPGVEAQADP